MFSLKKEDILLNSRLFDARYLVDWSHPAQAKTTNIIKNIRFTLFMITVLDIERVSGHSEFRKNEA